jgi:transcriptional regulator with XRE-family HTH domain
MSIHQKDTQPVVGAEKAFGQAFQGLRKALGISQERIALEAGCDRTTVSLIERGLVSARLDTIVRMCQIMKIRPSELMRKMEESQFYRA